MELRIERDGRRKVWRFVTSDHGIHTYSFDNPFTAGSSLVAFKEAGYNIRGNFINLSGVPHRGGRYGISQYGTIWSEPDDTEPRVRRPDRLGKVDGRDSPRAGYWRKRG